MKSYILDTILLYQRERSGLMFNERKIMTLIWMAVGSAVLTSIFSSILINMNVKALRKLNNIQQSIKSN